MALTKERLEDLLNGIDQVRVGVLGDFCLDMYWHADMTRSVLSRETPHFPLPIIEERVSPGAAGNVACNIAALKPARLMLFGALGDDWRGELLMNELKKMGADLHFMTCEGRKTNAYIKPVLHGFGGDAQEQARLDFENDRPLSDEAEMRLIGSLYEEANDLDVLCVCDQMVNGCVTERVREAVMNLGRRGMMVIVDSRDNIGLYRDVIVKPNEIEAARALEGETDCAKACARLATHTGRAAIVTAGADGCYLADDKCVTHVPASPAQPPFDICGAGDTFLSSFAAVIAAGAELDEAVRVGSLASSITICKLGMTGTASRGEILMKWMEVESR